VATFVIAVGTTSFDGVVQGVNPGDIILVTASAGRDYLSFSNVNGAAGNPVIIANSGGKVVFDVAAASRSYCVEFEDCDYVVFRGDNYAAEWGFKCVGYSNTAMRVWKQTEHIEIRSVEIGAYKAGSSTGAGMRVGTEITDAPAGFVVDEINIHHCYIHDTMTEAAYIGKALATDQYPIDDLIFEYNILDTCGYAGPQIRNAINVQCQRNWIESCGITVDITHAGGGMNVGDTTADPMSGHWRYNYVYNCERGVHQLTDDNQVEIHHNLIVECGDTGGLHDPQGGYKPQNGVAAGFKWYKNTVVDCGVAAGGYGVETKVGDANGEIEDCIVCGSDTNISSGWALDSNETGTTANQDFRAGDIWHHLTASSPAVGAAHDGTDCGWIDYN